LVDAFAQLSPERFFDPAVFPESRPAGYPELFWLRLLDLVQRQDYEAALEQLETNKDVESVNPVIHRGICQVLNYRVRGQLDALTCYPPFSKRQDRLPYLAQALDELESAVESVSLTGRGGPDEPQVNQNPRVKDESLNRVAALLDKPAVFPAILLAGGWPEAALRFSAPAPDVPAWLQTLWIDALRKHRGNGETLAYLELLEPLSDTRQVLRAELWLAGPERDSEALEVLERFATEQSLPGVRAADLLARTHFEAKRYNQALRTILANKAFSTSVPGHELAARIYIDAGDQTRAVDVLERIRPHSTFAREYLAIQAWQEQRYADSAKLLLDLLEEYPERQDLRVSLRQVLAAEESARE